MAHPINGTQSAFLIVSFAVVGLTGLMATYALPVPMEAAAQHEIVLEHAALQLFSANPAEQQQAMNNAQLRALLGRKAETILTGPPDGIAAKLLAERDAIRAHALGETRAAAARMRMLVAVATAAAALFGIILSGLRGRQTP